MSNKLNKKYASEYIPKIIKWLIFIIVPIVISQHLSIPLTDAFVVFCFVYINMYIAFILQVFAHETGHLICGLISGYDFVYYKVFGFMWIKSNSKIKFRSSFGYGTAGACAMTPPKPTDNKIPYKLFLTGGIIANLLLSYIFFCMSFLALDTPLLNFILKLNAITGIYLAVTNGLPLQINGRYNDGYRARSISKSPKSSIALYNISKIEEMLVIGARLKDIPHNLFYYPPNEELKNNEVATMGYLCCSYLIDKQDFKNAKIYIKNFLSADTGASEFEKNLLICNLIYCEIIDSKDNSTEDFFTKSFIIFLKKHQYSPTVIRMQYAYELLFKDNVAAADIYKKKFEDISNRFPFKCEIESETELMNIADKIYWSRNKEVIK